MVKKVISVILSAALVLGSTIQIVAAKTTQPELLLFDEFDGYATNATPMKGEYNALRTHVAEEKGKANKVLEIDLNDEGFQATYPVQSNDSLVFSFEIKGKIDQASGDLKMVNSSGTEATLLKIGEGGVISTYDGRTLGGIFGNKFKQIAVSYQPKSRRYSVYLDGKCVLNQYRVDQNAISGINSVRLNVNSDSSEIQQLWLDNVYIYRGDTPAPIQKQTAFKNKSTVLAELEVETANVVQYNLAFDDKSDLDKFTSLTKDNVFEWQQESNGNGYYRLEKVVEGTDYRTTLSLSLEKRMVVQADLSAKTPSTANMFGLRQGLNAVFYPIKMSASGALTTQNGVSLGILGRDWLNIAVAYNLSSMTYDVYVNEVLKVSKAPITEALSIDSTDNTYSYLVTVTAAAMTGTEVCIDNVRIYNGKSPADFVEGDGGDGNVAEQIKKFSTKIPNQSGALMELAGAAVVNTVAETAYYQGKKVKRIGEVASVEGVPYASAALLGDLTEADVVADANSIKVKNKDITTQNVNGVLLGNVEEAAKAAKLTYVYDDRGYAIISSDTVNLSDSNKPLLSNYMLYDRPTGTEIMEYMNENWTEDERFRVLASEEQIKKLATLYQTDEAFKNLIDKQCELVDTYIAKGVPEIVRDNRNYINTPVRDILSKASMSAVVYFATQKEQYKKYVMDCALYEVQYEGWDIDHTQALDTGHVAQTLALAYDWFYNDFTPEQRDAIAEALYNNAVKPLYDRYYGIGGIDIGQDNNRTMISMGGMTQGAIAIYERHPEVCAGVIANTLFNYEAPLATLFDNSGLWFEGLAYTNYAFSNALWMFRSCEATFGTDFNLLKTLYLDKIPEASLAKNGYAGTINFGDSNVSSEFQGTFFAYLAEKFNLSDIGALRHNQISTGVAMSIYDLLCYQPIDSGAKVEMPKDLYLPGEEYIKLSTSSTDKSGVFLAAHAGYTYNSHAHMDVGSFMLDMMGVRFACDLGQCDYSWKGYSSYNKNTKYTYYKAKGEGHNLPVINPDTGFEQNLGESFRDVHCEVTDFVSKDKGSYAIMDLTNAYDLRAKSVRRGFMLTDERQSAVIRDEYTLNPGTNTLYWFMHMQNADVDIKDSNTAEITVNGKTVVLTFLTNAASAELSVTPAVRMESSGAALDNEGTNVGYSKIAIKMTGTGNVNLTVKIAPKYSIYDITPVDDTPLDAWTIPDGELITHDQSVKAVYINGEKYQDFDPAVYSYMLEDVYDSVPEVTVELPEGMVAEIDGTTITIYHEKLPEVTYVYNFGYRRPLYSGNTEALQRYAVTAYDCSAEQVDDSNNNRASNAFDENLSTRWSAEGKGQWLMMDLGEVKPIEAFGIAVLKGGERYQKFNVLASVDGETWTEVYGGATFTENGTEMNYFPAGCEARYLKLVCYECSTTTWNSATEFAAYGN